MGGILRSYRPGQNCSCKERCNGGNFEELPPWPKLRRKSGLQGATMRGLLKTYANPRNCYLRVDGNGLRWWDFWGIHPPGQNCNIRVGCNRKTFEELPPDQNCETSGRQWEDFWEFNPPGQSCDLREMVIWSEEVKWFQNRAAKVVKLRKSEELICSKEVKTI